MQYIDYLNTSAQMISSALELQHLIVADPTTEGDKQARKLSPNLHNTINAIKMDQLFEF